MKIENLQFLENFRLRGGEAQNEQIASFLRDTIRNGRIGGGSQLPPLRELARRSGVNYFQLQRASEALMAEGLVYKVHGRGIFVCEAVPRRGMIALFATVGEKMLGGAMFPYQLMRELEVRIVRRGYEPMSYFDDRPIDRTGKIPDFIAELIRAGRITALIGIQATPSIRHWMGKLEIPHWTGDGVDVQRFDGLPELLAQSANPLFILPRKAGVSIRQSSTPKLFLKHGIDVTAYHAEFIFGGPTESESFAEQCYRLVLRAFERKKTPDLLVVYPDSAVPGAVAALSRLRIQIPDRLRLAFHRNVERPEFCPFPVHWLDHSIGEFAEQVLSQLRLAPENRCSSQNNKEEEV